MSAEILLWEDDPESGLEPIPSVAPDLTQTPLSLRMTGPQPPAQLYDKNSEEFRYWTAAGALARGTQFWGALLPDGTTWEPGPTLDVILDEGIDLNAYYDRQALNFFHDTVQGKTVYSGESPDILCHEMGHAVLDAVRPALFNAASIEAAAFHESFGDMSAILSALQVAPLREAVLTETGGHVERSSELSRLAEQLGWAIRQRVPDAVDADCLRNAANSFFYQDPDTLPSNAPASMLSSEPHSFSRVFTGAFFEALGGMLGVIAPTPTADDLLTASQEMGRLLIAAVQAAPVVSEYYSQVAAALIQADVESGGRFGDVLKSAFVRHGILSTQSAAAVSLLQTGSGTNPEAAVAAPARAAGTATKELPLQAIPAVHYGLRTTPLFVHIPAQPRRITALASALDASTVTPPNSDQAARTFVEELMRRGRIDFGPHGDPHLSLRHPRTRKTHVLERLNGGLVLRRKFFDCGFPA